MAQASGSQAHEEKEAAGTESTGPHLVQNRAERASKGHRGSLGIGGRVMRRKAKGWDRKRPGDYPSHMKDPLTYYCAGQCCVGPPMELQTRRPPSPW